MKIHLRLLIPDPMPADAGSRVKATIVDTTMADALHEPIAEATTILARATGEVTMEINVPDTMLEPRRRLSLQAHVDRGATGEIKTGDLLITTNVPVLTDSKTEVQDITARMTRI